MFCPGKRSIYVNIRNLKRKFDKNTNLNEEIAKKKIF